MTRDEFLKQGLNAGPVCAGEGVQLFMVAIRSDGVATERHVRQAMWDSFGSLMVGVRKSRKPSAAHAVDPPPFEPDLSLIGHMAEPQKKPR